MMDTCSKITPFERAWKEYVEQLSPKKKQRRFLMNCARALQDRSGDSPASAINDAISEAEKKHAMQPSRRVIRKYIDPVVNVLSDFDAIICTLISADPMPTAIIWGALKVIIDGLSRFSGLFETIKNELRSLRDQLEHITDHENLYGRDDKMQNLLCKSYFNIIRFWHRVDKECDNCGFTILKAVAPFSTKKLNSIVADMQHDAQEISKRANMLQAMENREEQGENAIARQEAADDRRKAEEERREQREYRDERRREVPGERFNNLCSLLSSPETSEPNFHRREKHLKSCLTGTCEWLLDHPDFVAWSSGTSSSPVLWLHGPPGSGKSTLCSTISHRLDSVAFHFCDFAQQYKPFEILRMLALQLLCKHWTDLHNIPQELCDVAQATPSVLENVQNMIQVLVKNQPKVYFLLDGLDEETTGERWKDTVDVLRFLIQLTKDFPTKVRVWCSSQPRSLIKKELEGYPDLDITAHAKKDIAFFLSKAIPEAEELEPLDQEKFLQDLHRRAECSFLWASLMISELQGSPTSLREMKELIERGLPSTLLEYYSLFFKRFKKSLRPLACKLFALIVFARRPLRLSELQEAIWCLNSKSSGYLNPEDKPFLKQLHEVSQPLIEMTKVTGPQVTDGQEEYTCRLFHSTLRDFLVEHPNILSEAGDPLTDLHISSHVAVEACLLYLCQARYAGLLVRQEGRWIDATGDSVDNQNFLVYAAKYWDKHLDDAAEQHKKELLGRLETFITSSNFQTCIQVQSLWVELQFCIFRTSNSDERCQSLRRVFPTWFSRETDVGVKLWNDYRCFLHEWKFFLSCGNCYMADPRCGVLPYLGQLDRIWFGALGPSNFLSRLRGHYTSFVFQMQDELKSGGCQCLFDGVGDDGSTIMVLRIQTKPCEGETLQISCETWSLSEQHLPLKEKCQIIQESPEICDWPIYAGNAIHLPSRVGKASTAAFSPDCQTLRIGTRLFAKDATGNFVALPRLAQLSRQSHAYVEEFCRRGRFVVLASRTKLSARDVTDEVDHSPDSATITARQGDSECSSESDEESMRDESTESEIDTESEDDGYESWSDSSTVFSEDYPFDDDMITPWADHFRDEDKDSNTSDSGVDSDVDEDSTESDEDVPPSAFGFGRKNDEDKCDWDQDYSSDEDGYRNFVPRRIGRHGRDTKQAQATITIYDAQASPEAVQLFRLTRPLHSKVYGSPPIIHPTRPLVVWPLGAGDILFVDFMDKSYFVRRLRPSTLHTRHIFMKCQFSACGRFLHIVSLEGQQPTRKKHIAEKHAIHIAVLVSTYRLSRRKTTRSPPTLMLRIRVKLGSVGSLSVTKLPFTVSWTPKDVYITCSDVVLRVFRVPLFKPEKGTQEADDIVLMPRKPVFLPESAQNRQVYYFPSKNGPDGHGESTARIVIGSETRKQIEEEQGGERGVEFSAIGCTFVGQQGEFSPPIGCYVNEEVDLGGWGKSYDTTEIPVQLGIGSLDHRLERFNPDDDCDLEPYIH
ncbi:hypothetical protein K503DRAFT_866020 [Rhizopogon vinicolor AM-OR11-026]|uniref:Uncharacterized protein n=1 Tax=Rhizopogon vinicolor AM-OR11-026 TaxID=1314800 RepID=A0A1B7N1A1_9AGAM|nr:hypothetical protein K503DRAFT_866020 [Rhizopogon vinicolor AM-OR11-026]